MQTTLITELRNIEALARDEEYLIALQKLDDLAVSHPKEYQIWTTRAYVHSRKGDSESAISDYSHAIALFDKEPHAFYSRGIVLFQAGRYRDAVLDFTRVIELCDLHKSDYYREGAYFLRADAYVRLKEFEKAKSDCAHVRDDMRAWTDKLRTKADILAACSEAPSEGV